MQRQLNPFTNHQNLKVMTLKDFLRFGHVDLSQESLDSVRDLRKSLGEYYAANLSFRDWKQCWRTSRIVCYELSAQIRSLSDAQHPERNEMLLQLTYILYDMLRLTHERLERVSGEE